MTSAKIHGTMQSEETMLNRSRLLLFVDASINLSLGTLLFLFPQSLVDFLGVPSTDLRFYPNILGAVLFGIGLALLIEIYQRPKGMVGLGLGGAIAINVCGGVALALLLILEELDLPLRGIIFLWGLVLILIVISAVELILHLVLTRDSDSA
jgi:hypothetical protein